MPGEAIDGVDDGEVDAAVGLGLDDDVDDVGADRESLADEVAVLVVARIRAQLRDACLRIADRSLETLEEAEHAERQGDGDDDGRRALVGDLRQPVPHRLQVLLALRDAAAEPVGDRHEGHQQRQQDQVGQDDDADAQAGGDRHLLDHGHADQQDRDEAHQVREQRDDRRQEQQPERAAGCIHAVAARQRGVRDRADLLHAVAGADREDDERHEDAERVDAVAEQHQEPQHPDHRHQRGDHRDQRDA